MTKKWLIILLVVGFVIVSGLFFNHISNRDVQLSQNENTNQEKTQKSVRYIHATFDPYTDEEKFRNSAIIAIVSIKSFGDTKITPGNIPFTVINMEVKQPLFSETEISKEISAYHEGSLEVQYDNFKFPKLNQDYLVFLNFDEQLQGLQIRAPESRYELITANNKVRVISPELREQLEKSYGHKNYSNMPEFKDNQYVISKSTGEKVKLTASLPFNEFFLSIQEKIKKYNPKLKSSENGSIK